MYCINYLEISTCGPSKHKMDNPILIVFIRMRKSIRIQRVNVPSVYWPAFEILSMRIHSYLVGFALRLHHHPCSFGCEQRCDCTCALACMSNRWSHELHIGNEGSNFYRENHKGIHYICKTSEQYI